MLLISRFDIKLLLHSSRRNTFAYSRKTQQIFSILSINDQPTEPTRPHPLLLSPSTTQNMIPTAPIRQAAVHAERTPLIRFLGRRSIPASIDHTPQPHPASPTGKLPQGFGNGYTSTGAKHSSFSSYRDHAQQFGPLQKTIKERGIGGIAGAELGPVQPAKGTFFDRSQLPGRFQRLPIDPAEMEAVNSGGAGLYN
ncbi:hypothetical protein jhhlp_001581 [Lomentospora prolificans]|uniref:Uncharacterized protein n=1 Tax=Lomentospora prolificans TaxID=41688 RepID=A0A2N3NIP1_9PEZI|nr:hypothetical protein jhhlp_001581 [Lomentospora prolificans]